MNDEIEAVLSFDSDGNPLTGCKNYKLHLPADIPAGDFWSVIVYDMQTRLIISAGQLWPSVFSTDSKLDVNADSSVDVYFSQVAPDDSKKNWIQTVEGKKWFMILRLYDPLDSWFTSAWRPGELEEIKESVKYE
jgi:hypothetical protein